MDEMMKDVMNEVEHDIEESFDPFRPRFEREPELVREDGDNDDNDKSKKEDSKVEDEGESDEAAAKNGSKQKKNPFEHFEVYMNGKKVTDPKEIQKDEKMFEDIFKGFDFGFNPLNVAQDVHGMNKDIEKRYNLMPDSKPGTNYFLMNEKCLFDFEHFLMNFS